MIFAALPFIPGGLMLITAGVAVVGRDHPLLRPHVIRLKLLRRTAKRWKRTFGTTLEMKNLSTAPVEKGTRRKWVGIAVVLMIAAVMLVTMLPFGGA